MADKRILFFSFLWITIASCSRLFPAKISSSTNIYSLEDDSDDLIRHLAVYKSGSGKFDEFYGAKATLNVYGFPNLKGQESSSAVIWILNNADNQLNVITTGWHVYPELYGDTQTHFFTLWAVDEQSSTGCYNLQCNGFVLQNATSIVPGVVLNPVSTVDGPQYEVTIKVFKDATSGDWWLYFGHDDNLNPVGYWPKSLFTSLANKATRVDFGGQVTFPKNDTGPPMGSGHFPEDHKAAYFKDTNYIDKNGGFFLPDNPDFRVDSPDCYNLGGFDTDHFLYGGPGGCTN
uniref:Neprosin PEP catalytic domain-containing protein n=1 Tax=Ananas comosus var. bracteatus TaxID=296719 RepID=A0A6V7QHI6_ANACO|nr:unnamed protein product [Ananas comosus var. bracteatus]